MQTLVIARLTFKEAARRKILLAALVLGIIFLIVFGVGYHLVVQELEKSPFGPTVIQRNEIQGFLYSAGLYVVNFLIVMMTVLTSVDTISGEIQSGTIHTLIAKPIRRWEILIGKFLGFTVMITLYMLLMAGGITLFVFLRSDYIANNPFAAMSLIWLNALVLLSVSLLGGTFLSTLANGVLVFGLFGIAFIGGWIEQIGSFLPQASTKLATTNIGIITSLILPSEALWKRAAFEIQSPLTSSLGMSPFVARTVPSPMMIVYAVLFLLVITGFAVHQFGRRDL